ncbi:histidine kinase [Cohnella lubricantis]|uniref:histidine kinase n=1 Tax=Cohnella lubricantis TaxID=2163172 RepID=A0A841T697_9BACL|nr:histidine kinase [Cohnella lubricantis]MBB6677063.1 sensor histidine kinase [Cohnella lubricantis]MBP2118910.1 signal transduction histidine kinase [Cohnella lubricantis]
MDLWIIGNKLGLLVYIILSVSILPKTGTPWDILAYLIYLCVNVTIPIFRNDARIQQLLSACSAVLVVYFAYRLDTSFVLLLPVNLYELVLLWEGRRRIALAISLIPLVMIPREELPVYILSTFLSFLLYTGLRLQMERLKRVDEERETLRLEMQNLSHLLNKNQEYIRQSEYTIKLEERNRLSQQIHDEVGHAMAGALIQMEASRTLLAANPDKSAELLGNAISISKEGLERIRLTLKDMKPRSEELGIHRLRLFADELSAKHALKATVTHEGNLDVITPMQWRIIHENATEAVTNSLKYGHASAIEIEVRVLNRMIRSSVSDNGIGARKIVKGLGIVGMEERAASVGGTVIVDGAHGFRVTTLLPNDKSE